MLRRSLFLALPLTLAAVTPALAQRSRSRATEGGHMMDSSEARDRKAPTIRARDVEDTDPLRLLIDKHKDLKLTDDQLAALKDADKKVSDTNKPVLDIVDSLARDMRGAVNDETPSGQARLHSSQIAMMAALTEAAGNYDTAAKGAIASWSADQQKQANELIDRLREDNRRKLRERMGGGQL